MSSRRATALLLAISALAGCGGTEHPVPAPSSVAPNHGSPDQATSVVIQGSGFSALVVQPSSGGAPVVNESFQAWLGDAPLQQVRRIDDATLSAIVPAGLPPGVRTLRVDGPWGTSGELANAFTVDNAAVGAMSAAISAAPATVSVGQPVTVTLTIRNTGTAGLTNVLPGTPSITGTATTGSPSGPTPASLASLAPGAVGSFTWTYPTAGAGTLAFSGSVTARSVPSGATVDAATDPTRPAQVVVQRPATLVATLPAAGAAAVGRDFTVSMTVVNEGGATVRNVAPGTPVVDPAGLAALKTATGPVPPSVDSLAPGASATFTWTFVAGTTPGTVRISAAASGTDANSGAVISSATATSGDFVIGAAGIQATLSANPATVNVGQAIVLVLTVSNPGQAAVNGFAIAGPTATSNDGAGATVTSGPTPSPPAVLGAGQNVTIQWSVDAAVAAAASTGHLTFHVTAGGVDAFSGTPISAAPTAEATVDTPAVVTATGLTATPATVIAGQSFSVTLGLAKTGGSAASVTGATLTGVACATPPTFPVPAVDPTSTLTWSGCAAPSTPQVLALGALATWVDAKAPLDPRTTGTVVASVPVQAEAGLAVAFAAQPPAQVSAGQAVTLTANVQNTAAAGGAAADGVTVTPSITTGIGTASATCGAATPGATTLAAGATQPYSFTCTVSGEGTLTFTASASGTAAGTGAALSASATTAPTAVQSPASVTAVSVAPSAGVVSTGQVFTVTLTLAKIGTAPADVTSATLTGAGISCTGVPPPVAGIAVNQTLTWTGCTATTSGDLSASAIWVDANLGGPGVSTNTVTAPITVQSAAVVTPVSLTTSPAPVPVGSTYSVTLVLSKTGDAPASVTFASLSGPGIKCTEPPVPVLAIPATQNITWTACDSFPNARDVPIEATVTWTDDNDPTRPQTTAPIAGNVSVQ